ncbi:DnaJ family domain-containing protein [Evansella cellulosilytica]|uniref:DnaJ homologue subfamily C member 28 conserved domain-containing protein n=1 Tax=Evansella cellulosilytica (strain ATCC 21833 / DSM 2522 / FERM P-1141 / JCM 9156 / N-4) TaxID=649639 RepID=E6TU68_EVAC2|nr:DnaJ family domain-containing protein [Evansella cellulosilytica]ADU28528.1 hypothetical protein Bcell_0241 [Evansella cellulosilytica DSM 2522]
MEEKYNDLIGDILERSGEKDNYEGKGKPLSKNYLKMDVYQNFQKIAKDAGYLPEWVKLQKEISTLISCCQGEEDVQVINEKIKKYNKICPTQLQRRQITMNTISEEKNNWK